MSNVLRRLAKRSLLPVRSKSLMNFLQRRHCDTRIKNFLEFLDLLLTFNNLTHAQRDDICDLWLLAKRDWVVFLLGLVVR